MRVFNILENDHHCGGEVDVRPLDLNGIREEIKDEKLSQLNPFENNFYHFIYTHGSCVVFDENENDLRKIKKGVRIVENNNAIKMNLMRLSFI